MLRPTDRGLLPWWAEHFGSTTMVSRGVLHDTRALPELVVHGACGRIGLLQYRPTDDQVEIVVLIACLPRQGIGRRLLESIEEVGRAQGRRRLWLITTNDNAPAIACYRAGGWRQCAVHPGAIAKARRLKPQIPIIGHGGVPIEDEIEFERLIDRQPRATDKFEEGSCSGGPELPGAGNGNPG